MSYTKQHQLPTGATVSVYKIDSTRIDYASREASVLVSAYVDATQTRPLIPIFAKLRLTADRFDALVSKQAQATSEHDFNAILYQAMRTEPVICDAGSDFFTDAIAT
jgi:hypothetical protein